MSLLHDRVGAALRPYDILVTDSTDWPLIVVSYSPEGLEPYWTELELALTEWVRSQEDDQKKFTVVTDQKVKNGNTNRFQRIELDRFGLHLDTFARVTDPADVGAISSLYLLLVDTDGVAWPLLPTGGHYQFLPEVSHDIGPRKFRKKPAVIEACRWDGTNQDTIIGFVGPHFASFSGQFLYIETLEGRMAANPGDWIIKGLKGEFYPCKPDIFARSYEEV